MKTVNNKQRIGIITLLKILTRFNGKFLDDRDLLNTFATKRKYLYINNL